VRAIFEPHQVRTDRLPGELDREKGGLVRVYDVEKPPPTYFFNRGDERNPDKERVMSPAVPRALCGDKLDPRISIVPVNLPSIAAKSGQAGLCHRGHGRGQRASGDASAGRSGESAGGRRDNSDALAERDFEVQIADAKQTALLAVVAAEKAGRSRRERN
jgi:hypothetical protein